MPQEVSIWSSFARSLGIKSAPPRDQLIQRHIANLKHDNEDMRRSAAWSLGKMRPVVKDVLPTLEDVAQKDHSAMVRKAAQWAINSINQRR